MIRSLASILAALNAVAPSFPEKPAAAAHVRELAEAGDFDPFTLVAYVEHESRWSADAVGVYSSGVYVGLGQHLATDPGRHEALLDWRFNLDETARAFVTWRGFCKEHVGSGAARYWLQGITGWDAKRKTTCGHRHGRALPVPEAVTKLLKRRAELAARF